MRRKIRLEMKPYKLNNKLFLDKEDSLINFHNVIGVEYELLFAPSSYLQRDLAMRLRTFDKTFEINDFTSLKERIRSYLGFKLSPLVEDEAELDGVNHEWKFHPISHALLRKSVEEVGDMMSFLTSIGYVDHGPFEEIGIHHNVDLEMLGADRTEQAFTLRRYLTFLFSIKEKLEALSLRKHVSTYLADIDYLLGDRYYSYPQDIGVRFIHEREIMTQYLIRDEWCHILGIILFPNERPLMEIRYFGSTFRVSEFMAIYEFTMGAILYCKQQENPSWNGFYDFIKERKYEFLREFILDKKLI